jgi:hypothetical protein
MTSSGKTRFTVQCKKFRPKFTLTLSGCCKTCGEQRSESGGQASVLAVQVVIQVLQTLVQTRVQVASVSRKRLIGGLARCMATAPAATPAVVAEAVPPAARPRQPGVRRAPAQYQ